MAGIRSSKYITDEQEQTLWQFHSDISSQDLKIKSYWERVRKNPGWADFESSIPDSIKPKRISEKVVIGFARLVEAGISCATAIEFLAPAEGFRPQVLSEGRLKQCLRHFGISEQRIQSTPQPDRLISDPSTEVVRPTLEVIYENATPPVEDQRPSPPTASDGQTMTHLAEGGQRLSIREGSRIARILPQEIALAGGQTTQHEQVRIEQSNDAYDSPEVHDDNVVQSQAEQHGDTGVASTTSAARPRVASTPRREPPIAADDQTPWGAEDNAHLGLPGPHPEPVSHQASARYDASMQQNENSALERIAQDRGHKRKCATTPTNHDQERPCKSTCRPLQPRRANHSLPSGESPDVEMARGESNREELQDQNDESDMGWDDLGAYDSFHFTRDSTSMTPIIPRPMPTDPTGKSSTKDYSSIYRAYISQIDHVGSSDISGLAHVLLAALRTRNADMARSVTAVQAGRDRLKELRERMQTTDSRAKSVAKSISRLAQRIMLPDSDDDASNSEDERITDFFHKRMQELSTTQDKVDGDLKDMRKTEDEQALDAKRKEKELQCRLKALQADDKTAPLDGIFVEFKACAALRERATALCEETAD